jgi:hypothetical protein
MFRFVWEIGTLPRTLAIHRKQTQPESQTQSPISSITTTIAKIANDSLLRIPLTYTTATATVTTSSTTADPTTTTYYHHYYHYSYQGPVPTTYSLRHLHHDSFVLLLLLLLLRLLQLLLHTYYLQSTTYFLPPTTWYLEIGEVGEVCER